jgi:hypothetical protein
VKPIQSTPSQDIPLNTILTVALHL